ncbi:hypothetical protein BV494_15970 [Rahnella sikkimica]|uniref:Uncharacterized protein n=1 Tax=Rahnella sikkimica TaxID=1805933 RepID=A0A2L1UTZ3_9GAMM|nr:hypothetical protein BV494_15970 [Rahnella sikkimica]
MISDLAGADLCPSYFKLLMRWLHPFTPVTYRSKLPVIHGFAAFKQLELFWVECSGKDYFK